MAGRFGSTKKSRKFGGPYDNPSGETGAKAAALSIRLDEARAREKLSGDKTLRIEKEFMLRQDDMDAELCHLTRLTPEPGAMAKRVFNIFDVVRQLINLWILTFALMELDNRWNEGFDLWRIYIGLAAAYVTVETLAIGAGVFMGFYNERFLRAKILAIAGDADPASKTFEDATALVIGNVESADGAADHITLPSLNTPVPRLGLVYHATLAAGWIITWSYLYMDLNTGDGINMVTFNDARTARVFVYLAALLSAT
ncbi:MAG TPA: hypothetical protein VLQ80_22820, partial [Candidatus Saccharimonadia bacterium]|nr:hypothetical protein [Candidatus Saccharimonadia bacterium]